MARWDACSAEYEGKLYIFGGHSLDGRSKNSMLSLDLKSFYLSLVKTTNPPSPRDGSCLLNYQSSFLLFGGSDGGEEDTEPYNDFWEFDIPSRTWNLRKTHGEVPRRRDGHAGAVIKDYVLIYGGSDLRNISYDIQALNLKTYQWSTLPQVGDLPGPRESMGYTTIHNKLYVFGGNTNSPSSKSDAYSNDLFEISLLNGSASCKKLSSEGPGKRLSVSMVSLDDRLAIFGGESFGVVMNDLWVFDLNSKLWSEVPTVNKIPARMAHVACVNNRRLLIYGGMDIKRNPLSDIAKIEFPNSLPQKPTKKPSWSCEICSHTPEKCTFLSEFPQLKTHYFFASGQLPVIQSSAKEFLDDLSAILYLASNLGPRLSIEIVGSVKCRGSFIVQTLPEVEEFSLEYMENEGTHIEIREEKIQDMNRDIDSEAYVLQVFSPESTLPDEVANLCAGESQHLNIGALFKLTDSVVIVSKTVDYISVALMKKEESSLPIYFVVMNSELEPLFPDESVFYPNWRNIVTGSHITQQFLRTVKMGTSFFMYSERIVPSFDGNDILVCGTPLRVFLSYLYYKPAFYSQLVVNGQAVSFVDVGNVCEHKVEGDPDAIYYVSEDFYSLSLLFYYKNTLVYWEMKGSEEAKRRRSQDVTVIIKTNLKKVVSKKTGLFIWNTYSARILFSLQEPFV